jgi:Ca2+-binding RTX toxin-like protein
VSLNPSVADLIIGETLQLTATVLPSNATSKDVTWNTSNEAIVTVSDGMVTGVAAGTVTITVTTADGGYTAESSITVSASSIPAAGIALTSSTLSLKENEYGTLGVVFTPNDATNRTVTWSTSDSSVATVVNGTVTAHGEGTATITATTEDGNFTATCTVTVTKSGSGSNPRQDYYEDKYPGKNVIIAPDGGGEVTGTDGEDVIVSGSGDDWLEGSEGSDVYVYEVNGGLDVISNVSNGENDQDELHFEPGIWEEDLIFSRQGNDLLIEILNGKGGNSGTITVEDWYLAEKNKLSKIVFDDGTELTTAEIEELAARPLTVLTGTAAPNFLRSPNKIREKVTMYGLGGADTFHAGRERGVFVGGPGDDEIIANMSAPKSSGGKKIFWWSAGDGNDTIKYFNALRQAGDGMAILRFGEGVSQENVEIQNAGEDVVFVVTLASGGGKLTFIDANKDNASYQPDEIHFADGSGWTWSEVSGRKVVRGTSAADELNASSYAGDKVTVLGLAGTDVLYGGEGEDTFAGGPSADTIYARSTSEGGGKKVFLWNAGDGNDTVYYYNEERQDGDGLAVMRFGNDINPEDIEVQNSENDTVFVITLPADGGSVTFNGANRGNARYQPDRIEFANGTVWTWDDAASRKVVRGTDMPNQLRAASHVGEKVTVYGLGGSDILHGGRGCDVFVGGPGDDTIHSTMPTPRGSEDKKVFCWNAGDGNDTINYSNALRQAGDGMAVVSLGSGIKPENVEARNSGDNVVLVITLPSGGGSLTFKKANQGDVRYQPDRVEFADGTVWTWAEMPR